MPKLIGIVNNIISERLKFILSIAIKIPMNIIIAEIASDKSLAKDILIASISLVIRLIISPLVLLLN